MQNEFWGCVRGGECAGNPLDLLNQIGSDCIYCLRATEGEGEPDINLCLSQGGSTPELPAQPPRLPDAVLPDNPSGKVQALDAQSVGLYQACHEHHLHACRLAATAGTTQSLGLGLCAC